MKLSAHDQKVLRKLKGAGWTMQHRLNTSRQTMNKLVAARLVDKRIDGAPLRYLPETGARYLLNQRGEEVING